jgi:hypothetical protein
MTDLLEENEPEAHDEERSHSIGGAKARGHGVCALRSGLLAVHENAGCL